MEQIQRLSVGIPGVPVIYNNKPSPCSFRSTFSPNSHHQLIRLSCNSLRSTGSRLRIRGYLVNTTNVSLDDHEFYMRRCVDLARLGFGHTSPYPMKGCVIVKDGKIIGEGFYPKAGEPHAEVFALRDAGLLAENATLYVNFEPFADSDPPCTEAIIKAKVKMVVVGTVDPNSSVSSDRLNILRQAGIRVISGVEKELCDSLNEDFLHQIRTGKPLVALRYTISVNGHFLNRLGYESDETAGGYYSQLLHKYDAVILSSASQAHLHSSVPTSQEPRASQPLGIIVSSDRNLPVRLPRLTEETASRIVIVTDKDTVVLEPPQSGVETLVLDQMNLNAILDYCKRRGCCSVLLETRCAADNFQGILREGIEQDLLQKVVVDLSPEWRKDDDGENSPVLNSLGKKRHVLNLQPKISGRSLVLEGNMAYHTGGLVAMLLSYKP